MARDTPAAWRKVMEPRRIYSLRELAYAAKVSPQTITRLVHGESTSDETVASVANVLRLPISQVWALHGLPRPNPFVLGPEADQLSNTQRLAVQAVVKAMLEGRGDGRQRHPLQSVDRFDQRAAAERPDPANQPEPEEP